MRLAVDLSSILWTCLLVGKDVEGTTVEFEGKKVHVNSVAYGYENVVNHLVAVLQEQRLAPIDMILVREGLNSKAPRMSIDPMYKGGSAKKRPTLAYEHFSTLRDKVCDVFRSLGACVITQDNVEADDVCAYLALHTEQTLVIDTYDNDLSALNGVNEYGGKTIVRVNGVMGANKFGIPPRLIRVYKALVGDSSDNIKGIKGFGPKAWEQFLARFGVSGLELMDRLGHRGSLDELHEDATKDPFVKFIFDGAEGFLKSWRLARLYPEWVNTLHNELQFLPGLVNGQTNDERLKNWVAQRHLVTAEQWESFKPWALRRIGQRGWLALDIETSTGDESDDWMEALEDPDGVDTLGSKLTGMSLTFGSNMQYTVYISVDHTDTANVTSAQVLDFIKSVAALGTELVIHNTFFEGPVLYNEWGASWLDNGYNGFLPNWLDTKLESSYVDENERHGLKQIARRWFNYNQVEYKTTTTLQGVGLTGGRLVSTVEVEATPAVVADDVEVVPATYRLEELRQYKMRELTASHVFDYACDDTVVTASFHNFAKLFMELEHTYEVYKEVEIDASYLHAAAFVSGANCDLTKLAELVKEDGEVYKAARAVMDNYLVSKGWEGTICPAVSPDMPAKQIKLLYTICTGRVLETAVRTPSKLLAMMDDEPLFQGLLAMALEGDVRPLTDLVSSRFTAAPVFNAGSTVQKHKLLYETIGLPVRAYNKPTEDMKARGQRVGNPKTDSLAVAYGLREPGFEDARPVLEALREILMVQTRRSLFYDKYPYFVHWRTGRIHSSHNQSATNTRRASSSKPNMQQLSKTEKIDGFKPRVRELIIPHKKGAVIVSLDFKSQETLLMAEWSKDPALVSVFVGDDLRDFHSLTGVNIFNAQQNVSFSYAEYVEAVADKEHHWHSKAKRARALGKAVNFGAQYRIAAPKLSTMLFCTEEEAQEYLDAKARAFPVAEEWSTQEMHNVKITGTVKTMLGAIRHLRKELLSSNKAEAAKAERQAISFRIQGSAAEMTKLAEGRMWKAGLLTKYDCEYVAPVHDEVVWSVALEDVVEWIAEAHALMTAKYASMELPVGSSCSIGWNFGEQVELEGDFSKENIYKALGLELTA